MLILHGVIKKPTHLIEIFSACNFLKINKLIIYAPKYYKMRSTKPVKINYENYINSFEKKFINFKIEIRKYKNEDQHNLIKKIISKRNTHYVAFCGDQTIDRILISMKKKITSIAITDGPLDSLSKINYFIIMKSRSLTSYLKIPLYLVMYNFFKLKYSFSFLKNRKYLFAKETINISNFQINNSLKKNLLSKRIHTLIIEDPTMTMSLNEIKKKYKLHRKNFCTIGRKGIFKIGNKIQKNISILPEVLINSNIINKIYVNPISSVCTFAKFKKIKIINLPIRVFHFDGCSRILAKYISNQFKKIR